MIVREKRDALETRVKVLVGVLYVLLVVIGASYWSVQVVEGTHFRRLADNNRLRSVPIEAPRGLIFDRNGRTLVENIPSYNLLLDRSRTRDLAASLDFVAGLLDRPIEELTAAVERQKGGGSFRPLLIVEGLTLAEVAKIEVSTAARPELEIAVEQLRLYRHGRQTAHVLGYLGEVNESELVGSESRLKSGDLVGRRGIESSYDLRLRGEDGERVVVVDSRGKPLEEYDEQPAFPGQNLTLALDLDLQQEAESLLGDKVGVVVALDPMTGEVLALVSSPSYNPNEFVRRLDRDEWSRLINAPDHPLHNRTLQSVYSPGSLFKVVMVAAGLSEGLVNERDTVFCRGATTLYNHRFRCWERRGHGRVNLHEALKHSCDVYFYHLGQTLGIERIADYARRFGLGARTGIDLEGEKSGLVPDPAWSLAKRRSPWYPGETISVAIGQGAIEATPLQIASMFATVANGGRLLRPHLLRTALPAGDPPPRIEVASEIIDVIREGLRGVVNEPSGTGGRARVSGLVVAGKTGTAQVVTQATWTSNDSLPYELRDHAWFGSFAPYDNPRLAVIVFVEHGGSGSKAAAPIARALYEHYFKVLEHPYSIVGG